LTPSNSTPSAPSSRNSDDELELMLSEHSRLTSNWNAVKEWLRRVGSFEQSVIAPSVNKLQNVSAQLDDAFEFINKKDLDNAREQLEQVNEDMYEALNGAVTSINEETQRYADDFGEADLNDHFRHYQDLSGVLVRITRQIENARQIREQQDALYRDVAEGADFKDLLKYFDELRGSEDAIGDSISKERWRYRKFFWVSGLGLLVGILAITPMLPDLWSGLRNLLS